MADVTIRVTGLHEVTTGFMKADAGLGREVLGALKDVGEVVKVDAQGRAVEKISHLRAGSPWAKMRLGVTHGDTVYIVPASRNSRSYWRRPKFGVRLLEDALIPAAEGNRNVVEKALLDALENLNQNAGLISRLHEMT